MTVTLVVSRYRESLDWLKDLPPQIKIVVYNKGPDDLTIPHINLPNVGREGHTFYYHICNNEITDDYTFFVQGNPYPHCSNLNYHIKQALMGKIPHNFLLLAHDQFPIHLASGCTKHPGLPFASVCRNIFGPTFNIETIDVYKFGAGGQFVIRPSAIKSNREIYARVVAELSNECDPIAGYVVERLHSLLLSGNMPQFHLFSF